MGDDDRIDGCFIRNEPPPGYTISSVHRGGEVLYFWRCDTGHAGGAAGGVEATATSAWTHYLQKTLKKKYQDALKGKNK